MPSRLSCTLQLLHICGLCCPLAMQLQGKSSGVNFKPLSSDAHLQSTLGTLNNARSPPNSGVFLAIKKFAYKMVMRGYYRSLLGLFWLVRGAYSTCYNQQGSASGDIQCGSYSMCCGNDWLCLSNRLCQRDDDSLFGIGSCTDQTYQNEDCHKCPDRMLQLSDTTLVLAFDHGLPLIAYVVELQSCGNGVLCCYNGTDCCSDPPSNNQMTLLSDAFSTVASIVSSSAVLYTPSGSSSTTPSSAASNPSTVTTISAKSSSTKSNSLRASSTQSTSTQPSSSTNSIATPNAPSKHSGLSSGAKAGIGVGVPLAIALFGGLIFILLRYRQRLHALEERIGKQPGSSPGNIPPVAEVPYGTELETGGAPNRYEMENTYQQSPGGNLPGYQYDARHVAPAQEVHADSMAEADGGIVGLTSKSRH